MSFILNISEFCPAQHHEHFENYITQIKTKREKTTNPFYDKIIEIFRDYHTLPKTSLDRELQKKIVSNLLPVLLEKVKELKLELDFTCLTALTLKEACELIIFSSLFQTFQDQTNISSEKSTDNINIPFLETLERTLTKKEWIKGNLISLFTEHCNRLKISKETQDRFIKPLQIIITLGQQNEFLDKTLQDLGIQAKKSEDPEQASTHLKTLISMQSFLFEFMDSFLRETLNPINALIQLQQFEDHTQPGKKNNTKYQFIHKKLIIFNHYAKRREIEGQSLCNLTLDSKQKQQERILYLDKLIQVVSNLHNKKIKAALDPLTDYLDRCQEGYEFSTRISLHEQTKISLFNLFFLHNSYDLLYILKVKEILENFLKEHPSLKQEPYDFNKGPKFYVFADFLFAQASIAYTPEFDQQLDQIVKEYSSFDHNTRPQWFKELLKYFSKEIKPFYSKLSEFTKESFIDFYTRIPKLEILELSSQSMTLQKIITLHHEDCFEFIQNLERYIKELKEDASDYPQFFINVQKEFLQRGLDNIFSNKLWDTWLEGFNETFNLTMLKFRQHIFSLNEISLPLERLNLYKKSLAIGLNLLMPALTAYRKNMTCPLSKLDVGWFLFTEKNGRKTTKVRWKKELPETPLNISIPKETSEIRKKEEVTVPTVDQISPHLQEKLLPPHLFRHRDEREIFEQDQTFHAYHALWTIDLLILSLKKKQTEQVALLGAKLVDHLYLIQEQGITPHYLSQTDELLHGLARMSEQIGLECSNDNDKGSIWYRYPHASLNFYQAIGELIPLGLQLISSLDQGKHEEIILVEKLIDHGIAFLHNLSKLEGLLPSWMPSLEEKAKDLKSNLYAIEPGQMEAKRKREIDLTIQKSNVKEIYEHLRKIIPNNDPRKTASLKDFLVHLRRLKVAIDLLEEYSEQRYLSFHEHTIRSCGQCLIEIAFSIISELKGVGELHTHHFKLARLLLDLDDLSDDLLLLEELNIKKCGDYPYWESVREENKKKENKKFSLCPGLRKMSEAYYLSIEAETHGEGFLPVGSSLNIADKKRKDLSLLISQLCILLKKLTDKMA